MSHKKIIFLDVDGVLHPFHGHMSESQITTFHKSCMEALRNIVEDTDAEIVLSSSWRNFASTRKKLLANLAQYGMTYTKWIEPNSASQSGNVSAKKLSKILAYVHAHNPADWIVLDDEDLIGLSGEDPSSLMIQLFMSRYVRTDPTTGLANLDAQEAIKILNSE
jgi:hypothetical protein